MTADFWQGGILGFALAIANVWFLMRIVKAMVNPQGKNSRLILLFIVKMVILLGVVALAFLWLKVSPEAFAIGYGIVILALILKYLAESLGLIKK